MKHIITYILVIAITCAFLCGCMMSTQKPSPSKLDKVLSRENNAKQYQALITRKLDIGLFIQKFDPHPMNFLDGKTPLITDFNSEFAIECLRKIEKGKFYSVHEVEQGGLLYVFYKTYSYGNSEVSVDETSDISGFIMKEDIVDIINWYYVKKKLAYQDFSSVTNGTDIEKVAEIDPATHIFIERADKYEKTLGIKTVHYLVDGILNIFYSYENGNLVVNGHDYQSEFQVNTYFFSKEEEYKGKILPIDVIKEN